MFNPPKNLIENHRFGDIQENAPLGNPLHSSSQYLTLDIGALLDQILGAHAVVDPGDTLLDNGPLVEVGGDKVGGGPDNLDTTLVGLVVRLGALEGGQEAVVDVDDPAAHGGAQGRGQDLHVAGEHDELDVVRLNQLQDLGLLLGLGVLGDGEVVELDAVAPGQGLVLGVVGHDDGDVDAQLARLGPEEQVVETVADLGDHDEHPHLLGDGTDVIVHLQIGGQGRKGRLEGLRRGHGPEVDAHEELVGYGIGELLQVHDVDSLAGKDTRHGVDDTGLVRAGQSQDIIFTLGGCHIC